MIQNDTDRWCRSLPAGVFLPAEWYEQDAIMLTWPHPDSDWGPIFSEVEKTYTLISNVISRYEKLIITGQNTDRVRSLISGAEKRNILIYDIPCNDTWARDFGPVCTIDGQRKIIHSFRFNGWGDKFDSRKDNEIVRTLYSAGGFNAECSLIVHDDFVLEGGSIETDGKGTILLTSSCLLNTNRNGHLSETDIKSKLSEFLGVKRFLWLDHGHLEGDDTDGHIDTLARFCDESTICYVQCNDRKDPHHPGLKRMEDQLRSFRTVEDQPYRLVALPMAEPAFDPEGRRLPATYANFLIMNGAVLVPVYGCRNDREALRTISRLFPGRTVTGINCSSLIRQGGSLHCITMQIPKGFLK
jgi:agmatine deiminase